ncbi:rhodanese-like domain-containing protein [Streptomyces sp. NPDC001177]
MTTPVTLDIGQARDRLSELTVLDVRTPGEYAAGHVPGAFNVPLDQIRSALPALREGCGELLLVCASGARAENARGVLAEHGVRAMVLTGGTHGWADRGHELRRPAPGARTSWPMERQVRLTAGSVVLTGLGLGQLHPAWLLLSAGIAGGLVLSAFTNTCGLGALLAKLPHNRPRPADLDATLAELIRHRASSRPT